MALPPLVGAILMGGGRPPIFASDRSISAVGVIIGTGSAQADLTVQNNGTFSNIGDTVSPTFNSEQDEWLRVGSASAYDVMCEYVSGDHLTTGTEDTWQNAGTNRTYAILVSGGSPDTATGVFNLRFRPTGGGSDLWSASLTLSAEIV